MTPRSDGQSYIGGNYRDLTPDEAKRMTSENSSDTTSTITIVEDDAPEVGTSKTELEKLPEGATYPLNSKRLVVSQLRRLAAMLELNNNNNSLL